MFIATSAFQILICVSKAAHQTKRDYKEQDMNLIKSCNVYLKHNSIQQKYLTVGSVMSLF
jgi:hypothetical protein